MEEAQKFQVCDQGVFEFPPIKNTVGRPLKVGLSATDQRTFGPRKKVKIFFPAFLGPSPETTFPEKLPPDTKSNGSKSKLKREHEKFGIIHHNHFHTDDSCGTLNKPQHESPARYVPMIQLLAARGSSKLCAAGCYVHKTHYQAGNT